MHSFINTLKNVEYNTCYNIWGKSINNNCHIIINDPKIIKRSAILNIGEPLILKYRKSITYFCLTLSIKLPIAPPNIKDIESFINI